MQNKISHYTKNFVIMASLVMLSACATATNKDPLEGMNRGIYKFNDVADKALIKPVATVYQKVTPAPIRKGINNFFDNLSSITTIFNDLLQFKFAHALNDAGRFVINSTVGIAGFFDVASMDNVPKHKEDFGQTLGHWGMSDGAYLVLPILGPSSLRDTTGLVFDLATTDPIAYAHRKGDVRLHNQLRAGQLIDKRTELLTATDLIDEASLDP